MSATFTKLAPTVHLYMIYWYHVVVCVLDLHFMLEWPWLGRNGHVYISVPIGATFTKLASTVYLDMIYWYHVVDCVLALHFMLECPWLGRNGCVYITVLEWPWLGRNGLVYNTVPMSATFTKFISPYKVLRREECKYSNKTRTLFFKFSVSWPLSRFETRQKLCYIHHCHLHSMSKSTCETSSVNDSDGCNIIFVVFRILIKVRRPKIWKKRVRVLFANLYQLFILTWSTDAMWWFVTLTYISRFSDQDTKLQ